ncbi:hypothetical protein [Niastella populi]|nr:hypothetical protein [Niastella populi]
MVQFLLTVLAAVGLQLSFPCIMWIDVVVEEELKAATQQSNLQFSVLFSTSTFYIEHADASVGIPASRAPSGCVILYFLCHFSVLHF